MFRNYFKTAIKNLWRSKVFSFINIAGLSVGLACCILILLYTKDEVSYDRFHQKKDRIYRITADMLHPDGSTSMKIGNTGMMPGPGFKRGIPEIEDFVRVQSGNFTIRRGKEVFDQEALFADENFFSIFSFPMIEGDPKTALNDLNAVVLSEELAEKYFPKDATHGKQSAMGKILELKAGDDFKPFVVKGITKKSPQNSSIQIKMLLPMKFRQSQYDDKQWLNFFLNTFVVLRPGSDPAAVVKKCNAVYNHEGAADIKEMSDKFGLKDKVVYGLQPLLEMHLSKVYQADNGLSGASNPIYSYILSGIACFILLIACINFINLTVARSLKRAKEIGIRKVVGGLRKQLVIQFLGESFILTILAFLMGIVLVMILLPPFNQLSNKALAFSYLLDARLITLFILLLLITGFLAGFYPALVLSGFDPVQVLYGRQRIIGKNYLSRGLVVLQFTLATFLIIATFTIYTQFNYLIHFDLGYNDKDLVIASGAGEQMDLAKLKLFRNELMKSPLIQNVSADQGGRNITIAHINGDKEIEFDIKSIDENYLPLLQIPIIKGRNFSKDIYTDTAESVLVNEAFVRTAGWKDPVGQVVDFFYRSKKFHVIGVVKDYHFAALNEEVKPELLHANPGFGTYVDVYVKLGPNNHADALNYIEKTFKSVFPFHLYQYDYKEVSNARQYEIEAKWKQLISFGALLTIFISCIGLFGLATLSAEKRTKEIGIRKVLGAPVETIVRVLSLDFMRLVLIAAIIASPAAWWAMSAWLQNYPYRISMSIWTFGIAATMVLIVALFTISFQTIRAALAKPVNSLRTE